MNDLGIRGINHVAFYVRRLASYADLMRSMGFQSVGGAMCVSQDDSQAAGVFRSGPHVVRCVQPLSDASASGEFLARHPDGIGMIAFAVQDVRRTAELLAHRGGTLIGRVKANESGALFVDLTTPLGDVIFRFVEQRRESAMADPQAPYHGFDHFTCHFKTMGPVIWWFREVMGFQPFWQFEFHTSGCEGGDGESGTGMRSQVMRCPVTGITFALNEPLQPDFRASQVWKFVQSNGGPGVQHLALNVPDVCGAVERLGCKRFLDTPGCYYDDLSSRLGQGGVRGIGQCLERLRSLGVLVDTEGSGHLLQIFLHPFADLLGEGGSPFFFELIQREGARSFGEGNFRALFESVARAGG